MKIFCNSQGTQSRDPNVVKHNGKYYWTYAHENRLYIMEGNSIDDFEHGEVGEEVELLEYHAHLLAVEVDGFCNKFLNLFFGVRIKKGSLIRRLAVYYKRYC